MTIFRSGKPWAVGRFAANTVVPAGSQTMLWDQVTGDPGGWAAGVYTVDRAGLYLLTGGIARAAATAVSSEIIAALQVDGVSVAAQYNPPTLGTQQASVARILQLDVGAQVSLLGRVHGTLSGTVGANQSYLALARIGPVKWTG